MSLSESHHEIIDVPDAPIELADQAPCVMCAGYGQWYKSTGMPTYVGTPELTTICFRCSGTGKEPSL